MKNWTQMCRETCRHETECCGTSEMKEFEIHPR